MIDGFDVVFYPPDDEPEDPDAPSPRLVQEPGGDGTDGWTYDFRPHLEDPE